MAKLSTRHIDYVSVRLLANGGNKEKFSEGKTRVV